MQPAEEFNQLKLRKEVQRRLRCIKSRLHNMPIELAFAEGRLDRLPARIPEMPDWAKAAAISATVGLIKPIAHLQPKKGGKYEVGDLLELVGHFQALVSFMQNPSKEVSRKEKELPELAELRIPVAKQTGKMLGKFLGRITRHLNPKPLLPSPDELIERYERLSIGAKSFATPDGEIVGFKTLTTRVNYLIWMFRDEFAHQFNAPYIHAWLKREVGESPSDKLVEAIVTKLRKDSQPLGNPKAQRKALGN